MTRLSLVFLVGCVGDFELGDLGDLGDPGDPGGDEDTDVADTDTDTDAPPAEPITGTWAGDCVLVADEPNDLIPLIEATLALVDDAGALSGSASLATFDEELRPEETLEGTLAGSHDGDGVLLELLADGSGGGITLELVVDGDAMIGRMDAEAIGDGSPDAPHYDCALVLEPAGG